MSLIREALEKARREGQRPESSSREPQYPAAPIPPIAPTTGPWRAHRREERPTWPRTLAIVLASVAASGLLTVFLIRRGDETLIPAPAAAQAEPVAPAPRLVVSPAPPPPAVTAAPPSVPPAPKVRTRTGRGLLAPEGVFEPKASSAAPPAAEPSEPRAPSPPKAEAAPELHLDGIVASATNPIAVVNGRLLALGESIEGYRVTRIDSGEVELEKDGAKTLLRLR